VPPFLIDTDEGVGSPFLKEVSKVAAVPSLDEKGGPVLALEIKTIQDSRPKTKRVSQGAFEAAIDDHPFLVFVNGFDGR
jgi:hypothetical protein